MRAFLADKYEKINVLGYSFTGFMLKLYNDFMDCVNTNFVFPVQSSKLTKSMKLVVTIFWTCRYPGQQMAAG